MNQGLPQLYGKTPDANVGMLGPGMGLQPGGQSGDDSGQINKNDVAQPVGAGVETGGAAE